MRITRLLLSGLKTASERLLVLFATAALLVPLACAPPSAQEAEDPFLWLEDVEGEQAMEWVLAQNELTRTELRAFPAYQELYDNTLAILTSTARIAYPAIQGDMLYNFWTDGDHPRGVYRRTGWESYLSGSPEWEIVLDMDALVAEEGTPWAFRGMNCLLPEAQSCLVSLSPGGSDAVEVREFDMATMDFVAGGFAVPVSKNTTAWVDENTILLGHNLNEGYVTTSGYSRAAWRWERGTPLEEAPIIAEAGENDMGVFVATQETPSGPLTVVARLITIFEREYQFLENGELVTVDVPSDAQMNMVGDQLILQLVSDWTVGGQTFNEGSVVSANLEDYLAGERNLELVVAPGERSTINGTSRRKRASCLWNIWVLEARRSLFARLP